MEKGFDTNVSTIPVGGQCLRVDLRAMIVTGGRAADMFGRRNASFLFSLAGGNSGYNSLVVGMLVLGVGVGSFYPLRGPLLFVGDPA